jgi:hypothetical protein
LENYGELNFYLVILFWASFTLGFILINTVGFCYH